MSSMNLQTAVKRDKLAATPDLASIWPSPRPLYVSYVGLKEELKRWL
jgi:hypothetical protein